MRKTLGVILLSAALAGGSAFAAEQQGRIERKAPEIEKRTFDRPLNMSLGTGVMAYEESITGNLTSRFITGVNVSWNAATLAEDRPNDIYYGLSSGILISHLGDPTSNLFGTNPTSSFGQGGANAYIVPMNLVAGYEFNDSVLVTVNGGVNLVYRSIGTAMNLGRVVAGSGNSTEIFPNVGAAVGWELGKSFALVLKGDFTLTPGDDFFVGTLGATVPLG